MLKTFYHFVPKIPIRITDIYDFKNNMLHFIQQKQLLIFNHLRQNLKLFSQNITANINFAIKSKQILYYEK